MKLAWSLSCVIVLLYVVQTYCGEGHGKEPQPKLPPTPKIKEEKKEKEFKQSFSACYQGYTLTEKKCIKKFSEPPIEIDNSVTVPYFQRCPPGFDTDKKSNICSNSVEVLPEYYCPSGWIDNVNNCVIKESPTYAYECPKGKKWELIDNRCISTHYVKQVVNSGCPKGARVEDDGHCWTVIGTYDCTPEKKEKKEKEKKKKHEESKKLRQLGEGIGKEAEPKDEEKRGRKKEEKKGKKAELLKEMQQVTAPTSTKVGVASQLCEKKMKVEPLVIISCPEGYVEIDNQECMKEEVTAPIRVCALKKKKNDECEGVERETPKVAKCPAGTEKIKNKCIQTNVVPPLNMCAFGWTDTGAGCLGHLDEIPSLECRPGLKLVDGQCVGELIRHPVHVSLNLPVPCENKNY